MKLDDLVASLSPADQEKLLQQVQDYKDALEREKCQKSFMSYVKKMWPGFIHGRHHALMAKKFEEIAEGKLKRLCISLPPRHTKSEFGSFLLPSWYMGQYPNKKIMQASNTGELAVSFGRKVRNLVMSEQYAQIFPDVSLRQDSKAAGRWSTNKGGEYFACLRRYAIVETTNGPIPAGQVQVGDRLLNCGHPVTVLRIYHSKHLQTFRVAGLDCSANHPIWTMNRGWVEASKLKANDLLRVASIWDRIKAFVWRSYGYLEHSRVSPLVQHQVPLRKSKQREVPALRWARDYVVQALAGIREFCARYGVAAVTTAYGGAYQQRWAIQPGELPVGESYPASQQQTDKCAYRWQDAIPARQRTWDNAGCNSVPYRQWHGATESNKTEKEELRSYGDPENLGWLSCVSARIIKNCWSESQSNKSSKWTQRCVDSIGRATQNLCGVLLGVRTVGDITVTNSSANFVNFLTDGDHTFFADKVLTHNCGVGGTLTGRGADLLIIDDPHNEGEAALAAHQPEIYDKSYEWFTSGPRQRLQPNGAIVIIATRWSKRDLIGRVLKAAGELGKEDEWEVIELPAIMPSGKPLWPEFWSLEELSALRDELPPAKWNAQYQQNPTAEEGAIIKREWWKIWEKETPPSCEYVIQSWDTAFTKGERNDYSACTTWGVFHLNEDENDVNIVLLDCFKKRMEFPELKEKAHAHYLEWEPDSFIVEAKAAGAPLIFELRKMGIPVSEYTPSRGNDKFVRINSVADLFQSGKVWAPDTRWARELIDNMAAFPNAQHDDDVDSAVQALIRFRQGGFLRLQTDEKDEMPSFRRKASFY